MKICLYDEGRLGVVVGQRIYDASSILSRISTGSYGTRRGDELIENLDLLRDFAADLDISSPSVGVEEAALKPPVGQPRKLIAAPINYLDHLAEAQADPMTFAPAQVRRIHEMGLFLKATSSLVGCSEGIDLVRPERRTDHEVELAVVIGQRCKDVSAADALAHVAGYAIGLDITVRGSEERSLRKSADSYSVLGPWLVTADELGDPSALAISLEVNGERRQDANTRDLVIDVPGLIELASSWYTLEPGDVIFTGTPAGVGPIAPGDLLVAAVEGIGTMKVRVH